MLYGAAMKRIIMLEIEAESDAEVRQAGRIAAYAVWGLLGERSRPVVKATMSAEATVAMRTAWEVIP